MDLLSPSRQLRYVAGVAAWPSADQLQWPGRVTLRRSASTARRSWIRATVQAGSRCPYQTHILRSAYVNVIGLPSRCVATGVSVYTPPPNPPFDVEDCQGNRITCLQTKTLTYEVSYDLNVNC